MKRIRLFMPFLFCFVCSLMAQENMSEFLFEDFREGVVIYKDGRQFSVPINYNFIDGHFLFVDKYDEDQKKQFAEPEMVSAIRIGDRTFLPTPRGATEILQFNPVLYVQYKGKIREKDKKVAYGGRSATSAVQTYSGIQSGGRWYQFEGERAMLAGIMKTYQINIAGKKKNFMNEKQYLKLFPDKKTALVEFIRENQIDFNTVNDVIALYNFTVESK